MTPAVPTRHWPVAGFQISARLLTPVSWFSTSLPPVASTLPSGSTVALTQRRCVDIDCVGVATGTGPLMSMTVAAFELPPICKTLPGRYIAAPEVQPALADGSWPIAVKAPVPAALTKYILPVVS